MTSDRATNPIEFDALSPERDAIHALLIDDDAEDVFLFSKLLAKSKQIDFTLTSCGALADAARLLARDSYDIVYIDYWLGLETSIGFILGADLRRWPPVVLITGLDTPDIRRCAYRAGASAFLAKDNLSVQAVEGVTLAVLERHVRRA
jgi:DNA-binding NtrC family response regulator